MTVLYSNPTKGTWLQPAIYAGPNNGCYRMGYALCADGVRRAVRAKLPDTTMSIPAYIMRKGRRVRGYLTVEGGVYYFHEEHP